MAGSFYHLILAERALPHAFPDPAQHSAAVRTAFAAGTVAPDLGFYPGGPHQFSHRVHHENTGDFVRAIVASAQSIEEQAFAMGWALHVITDTVIHPFINAEAARRWRQDYSRDRSELWHKKLEWGFDCHVLSSEEGQGIDVQVAALVKTAPGSTFLAAAAQMYEGDASENDIRYGWTATMTWIARLLRILLWTGNVSWPRYRFSIGLCARPVKPLLRGAGRLLAASESLDNAAAVARPHIPDADFIGTMTGLGDTAIERYAPMVAERFSTLANLDLDTGLPITQGQPSTR